MKPVETIPVHINDFNRLDDYRPKTESSDGASNGDHEDRPKLDQSDRWRPSMESMSRFDPRWRISDALLDVLVDLLEQCRPQSILETGPGLSSLLFHSYAAAFDDVDFISIDQPGPHHDALVEHASSLGFRTTHMHACDIVDGYYDLSAVSTADGETFELFLIDGPAGSRGRGHRRQLELLHRHGAADSIYIIDDTHRPTESSLIASLADHFDAERYVRFDVPDDRFPPRSSTVLLPVGRLQQVQRSVAIERLIDGSEPITARAA